MPRQSREIEALGSGRSSNKPSAVDVKHDGQQRITRCAIESSTRCKRVDVQTRLVARGLRRCRRQAAITTTTITATTTTIGNSVWS